MTRPAESSPRTFSVLSSEELACRAQAGSLPCFAELVHRYQGRLYNFLLRRNGDRTDAEDLTQETFLRAWERIGQYKPKWRFSTWLYTIGSRLAINHFRAGARHRSQELGDSMAERFGTGDEFDPSEQCQQAEARQQVWEIAMHLLTPEQHSMVWLRYAEDLSTGEIAKVLGKTKVSVRVTLHRARHRIAEALKADETFSSAHGVAESSQTQVGSSPVLSTASEPMTGGVS